MASNDNEILLQCCKCQRQLDMEGKTLTCLHSFCETCVNQEIQRQTSGNGQCPLCDETFEFDQLTLSPILVGYLKCRQMESTEWECDLCLEDGIESIARNWCNNCQKFFCAECYQFHKKFHKEHYAIELAGIDQEEIRKWMRTDVCKIHNEIEEFYCKRCNMCLCDTCYTRHVNDSGDCSSHPMSVREEALKKLKDEGPTLLKQIEDLEKNLEERKEKSRFSSENLEKESNLQCEKLWQNYKELIEELKEKTHKMCDELRRITNEQVEKGRKFIQETEKMLKKLEIWRLNLQHLLKKGPKEKNIVFGVELVAKKLESSFPELHEKLNEPLRELQLRMEFSDFWKEFLLELPNKMIGSGSLDFSDDFIQLENEWNLPKSNTHRHILSIVVSHKDNHLFLAEHLNRSIIEMKETGEFVCELILKDEKGNKFFPQEMAFISSEMLWVVCGSWGWKEAKIFCLERKRFSPFLEIKKSIITRNKRTFSVCQIKNQILICDFEKFEIDFYTEKDGYIKTIDIGESGGDFPQGRFPRIRTDPSTGNIWGAMTSTCKIFCFNEHGQKLQSFEIEEKIWDFSLNEFGEIYFSNKEGIFAFFPGKNLFKYLHEFQEKSEILPENFVTRKKFFVGLKNNQKYLFKIFKFLE